MPPADPPHPLGTGSASDLALAIQIFFQVTDILARLAVCEKASIDECYLDISEEARRRMKLGPPALPVNPDRVHICGQVLPPIHFVNSP